jgi:hypothetical protein
MGEGMKTMYTRDSRALREPPPRRKAAGSHTVINITMPTATAPAPRRPVADASLIGSVPKFGEALPRQIDPERERAIREMGRVPSSFEAVPGQPDQAQADIANRVRDARRQHDERVRKLKEGIAAAQRRFGWSK